MSDRRCRKTILTLYVLGIVGCVVSATLSAVVCNAIWRSEYPRQVLNITHMTDQYFNHRRASDKWPEANDVYGDSFGNRASVQNGGKRLDTWTTRNGPWVQFELAENGHIYTWVSWEQPRFDKFIGE